MRKIAAAILIVLCLAAAGCGGKDGTKPAGGDTLSGTKPAGGDTLSGTKPDGEGTGTVGADTTVSNKTEGEDDGENDGENLPGETLTLRIVDGAETGNLVLAGESAGEVYTLYVGDTDIFMDGMLSSASVIEDGMLAEIRYTGGIMETWPGQIGNVESVSVYSKGTRLNPLGQYYDLCGLYLQVLNDLWDVDSGLNGGSVYVSVDLSEAPGDLTEGEKEAIAWVFAGAHDVMPLTLTYQELAEQGYLSEYGEFADDEPKFYEWADGVLFSITARESEGPESYSLPVLRFNAEKWRSPLGAYFYEDCKAVWAESGSWGSYSVGAELIS